MTLRASVSDSRRSSAAAAAWGAGAGPALTSAITFRISNGTSPLAKLALFSASASLGPLAQPLMSGSSDSIPFSAILGHSAADFPYRSA